MKIKKSILLGLDIICILMLFFIDQYTKKMAVIFLKNGKPITIWKGILELNYLENTGAAFGILQNQRFFFLFTTPIILFVILYMLVKIPIHKKYKKLHVPLVLFFSGGIGNMIDRIKFDYVVDFFKVTFISFPTFNCADIYVTFAYGILFILMFFVYKESDFDFLLFKTKIKK